jgi:hypothetical protein
MAEFASTYAGFDHQTCAWRHLLEDILVNIIVVETRGH